jgi:hypothetical protein
MNELFHDYLNSDFNVNISVSIRYLSDDTEFQKNLIISTDQSQNFL